MINEKNIRLSLLLLALLFFLPALNSFSQIGPNSKSLSFKLTFLDSVFTIGDKFLIQNSDTLRILDFTLERNVDYNIDYRNGIISIPKNFFANRSLDTTRVYDLIVIYDLFPYVFKDYYSNFDITLERDSVTGDTVKFATTSKDFIENIFEGTDLEKSGSIFRGVTFGSNRDLTLNSGFRLQLNGKLSKEIEIIAALTDENTPIQPEGNTTKLQELDKVFIELRSSNLTATIGDIDIGFQKSEFVNFSRKIQGAKGFGQFDFADLTITGAVSRGKFNTNKFNGQDGLQGPYRLSGANNEVNIVVLSGTEKVYIDGVQMTRGDQADYTIDYALGQITFTNKRIITRNSRITVDFEYSDRKYSRTLLAFNNKYNLFSKNLNIGVSYISESDNEDKTIDFTLSDSDKEILKNAGSDKLKASKSGVLLVGKDSLGRALGAYIKKTDSTGYVYYVYNPGDTSAIYSITFSNVGSGNGDYNSLSTFNYVYAGKNKGSYAPVIFLPVPTSYQLIDFNLEFSPGKEKNLLFRLESAYSMFNKNLFSDIPDAKEGGIALLGVASFRKKSFKFAGINVKDFEIAYKQRLTNQSFNSLDRINAVEFNRDFDVQDSSQVTEDYKEGTLVFSPGNLISLKGFVGSLKRGDIFNSFRASGTFEFNNAPAGDSVRLPRVKYSFENVSSDFVPTGNKGNWIRQNALLAYDLKLGSQSFSSPVIGFNLIYNGELKKNSLSANFGDSLTAESFSFNEIIPRITITNLFSIFKFLSFRRRPESSSSSLSFPRTDLSFRRRPESTTTTPVNTESSSSSLSFRRRFFSLNPDLSGPESTTTPVNTESTTNTPEYNEESVTHTLSLYAEFGFRNDESPFAGSLANFSKSYTPKLGLAYSGSDWIISNFDIAILDKKFSQSALQSGNVDNKTVLVTSRTRLSPFNSFITTDLFYNVTSEQTAKIEKLFVLVPIGQGNYIYLGDLNVNGIQDENEFQLVNQDGNYIKLNVPTDQRFPTVDLKTSLRVYVKPSRYFYMSADNFIAELVNNFSAETIIKVDEKSKDQNTDNLYFLKLNSFLNDSNTITGLQSVQQDINLFENNRAYSLRLRFLQQKGFNQYSSGNERLSFIQKSALLKLGLTDDIGLQLEYINKLDKNLAPPNSVRNRDILSDAVNTDISYKPIPQIESGFEFKISRATDFYPIQSVKADINQQILRFIYSFAQVGRIRAEIERDEVIFNNSVLIFPYELTQGKVEGKSWFWRLFFDYSLSKNIQISINYDGRSEGNRKVIHSGRGQVTAFF